MLRIQRNYLSIFYFFLKSIESISLHQGTAKDTFKWSHLLFIIRVLFSTWETIPFVRELTSGFKLRTHANEDNWRLLGNYKFAKRLKLKILQGKKKEYM
jgi:hypothetical protein